MNIFASSDASDPVCDRGVGWACFSGAPQRFSVHFRRGQVLSIPIDGQSFRIFHRNVFWNDQG
jgi:hypothetical protein